MQAEIGDLLRSEHFEPRSLLVKIDRSLLQVGPLTVFFRAPLWREILELRNVVSADPESRPFRPSACQGTLRWARACLENGPIFASGGSQSTRSQRDSGLNFFTPQVSEVGSFGGRRRGISIQFPHRPARNRATKGRFHGQWRPDLATRKMDGNS